MSTDVVETVAKAIFDADPIRDRSMPVARKKARAAIQAFLASAEFDGEAAEACETAWLSYVRREQ